VKEAAGWRSADRHLLMETIAATYGVSEKPFLTFCIRTWAWKRNWQDGAQVSE
jgi:hypothetical protein